MEDPKMAREIYLALGPALLLLSACDGRTATDEIATTNEAESATNGQVGNKATTAPAAADFAAAVAASDLYEIQSGELAVDKAASAEVKSFAQTLIADHKKSTIDLKSAVARSSPAISVEPVLDQEKLTMIEELKKAPAGQFDQAFIDQQKQAHQKALALLQQYESGGDNQALRDFAAKAAGVVQGHLDHLNRLQP
jgi:putative membrane protein